MKIEVNLRKRQALIFLCSVFIVAGLFAVTAYGGNNPSNMGHTPGELAPGVFGGGTTGQFNFPGKLGVGNPINLPSATEVVINDTDNTGDAGLALVARPSTGRTYIDFYTSAVTPILRASIFWDAGLNAMVFNGADAVFGNRVRIAGATSSEELSVNGKINVQGSSKGFCYGSLCRQNWEAPSSPTSDTAYSIELNSNDGQPNSVGIRLASSSTTPVPTLQAPWAGFCALAQTGVDGGSGFAGCQVTVINNYGSFTGSQWVLSAYRGSASQHVYCRAVCLMV